MVNYKNSYEPEHVSHPGDTLSDLIEERCMSQKELSERMGCTPKHVNEIIKGKAPITHETALKLETIFKTPASFWNNRQSIYDDFIARKQESKALEGSLEWLSEFPIKAMVNMNYIPSFKDPKLLLKSLLEFFGVASVRAWNKYWGELSAQYRKPKKVDDYALSAWLRRGEILTENIECNDFDKDIFKDKLPRIKTLSRISSGNIIENKMKEYCAEAGVKFAFVPELPKTASGATRWLNRKTPLIQLSLRYKYEDQIWFSFFHEAAHVLLHKKSEIFINAKYNSIKEEEEADRFASNVLIPDKDINAFINSPGNISKNSIKIFARALRVSPGIVVGRLQHMKVIPYSYMNDLREKYEWNFDE